MDPTTPTSAGVYATAGQAVAATQKQRPPHPSNPCSLFAITQYECAAAEKIRCWPLERIFRQCAGGPAIEVTNRLLHTGNDGSDGAPVVAPLVDPSAISRPPRGDSFEPADFT